MEAVRVVRSSNEKHIITFCNPILVQHGGLTLENFRQRMEYAEENECIQEFYEELMQTYLLPFVHANTDNQYTGFAPFCMEFRPLYNNLVLPVIEFQEVPYEDYQDDEEEIEVMKQWPVIHECAVKQYITDFEKEHPYKDETKDIVIRFSSLRYVFKMFNRINGFMCDSINIYKLDEKYYVVIRAREHKEALMRLSPALAYGRDFGKVIDPKMRDYIVEHGELVADNPYDLCVI